MYPVAVLLNVLGQLLVFLSDLAVLLFSVVLMLMFILLYCLANKMMMNCQGKILPGKLLGPLQTLSHRITSLRANICTPLGFCMQ